jgi:hypothetical protein
MAIRKASVDILTVAGDTASGTLSFGKKGQPGVVHKFEFKGDDADVDTNNTLALHDRDGRMVFAATALDGGTNDATVKNTDQLVVVGKTVTTASTFGVSRWVGPLETDLVDNNATADFSADTEGQPHGICAVSPLTIALASGTVGDWHRVTVWVEV